MLRQSIARVLTRRVGVDVSPRAVAEGARLTHADLVATFAPLISSGGVEALWGRAFVLVQREYPAEWRSAVDNTPDEPFSQMSLWLEFQAPSVATDAAAAMFATFAQLLATLIGEPLTTRYLERAWTDGVSDAPRTRENT